MKLNRLQDHLGSRVFPFSPKKRGPFFFLLLLILLGPWGGADVFGPVVFSRPENWQAQIHLEFSPETLAREPELDQKLDRIFSRHIPPQGAVYRLSRHDPAPGGRGYTLSLAGTGGRDQLKKTLQVATDPTGLPGDGPMVLELSGPIGPGELLPLSLPANPSTGYIWEITAADPQKIVQREEGILRAKSLLLGAPLTQTIVLEGSGGGETTIQATYRRPWLIDQPVARKTKIQVSDLSLAANLARPEPTPMLLLPEPTSAGGGSPDLSTLQLAGSFDWRNLNGQNYMPPVRNQGSCGSCWAFGTVAPLEAAISIKQGLSVDLSEQYLISCDFGESYNYGCNGGWFAHQYHQWKIPSGEPAPGAVQEADYPYTGTEFACATPHAHPQKITNWSYVTPTNPDSVPAESAIKSAIAVYGAVAAAVCSVQAMAAYRGGIFSTDETFTACGGGVNHAIALVGWDDAEDIWIMRNSWGALWGEGGYMRIKRNVSNIGYAANYVTYDPPPPSPFIATHWSYLPIILSNHNTVCQEPLCNGNFEGGPSAAWSQSSAKGWELVMNLGDYDYVGLYNHQGNYAAWLGGDYSETAFVYQEITIPAAATQLGYWYWIDSVDSCGFDFAKVYFGETLLKSYDLCYTRDTGTWVYDTVDVSAYRGLTGILSFQVTTDEDPDLISSLLLDDVAIVTGAGQPFPTRMLPVGSPASSSRGGVRRKTDEGKR
ncbi:MAG: protease inhibitor I42 family protein [Deltaproteobacteria bacterium]|nr:protease inhibitor I42 family protein [Deltaproteobacteria bacterium]